MKRPSNRARGSRAADDPLASLVVIDRLEVAPARVERRRLVVPYRVTTHGATTETDLAYTYEEDVFDPEDPSDRNLAQVIGAQVALNYGLFCDEIVLRGPLDPVDQAFLSSAARNTAREVYVNKFLTPNPFLRGRPPASPSSAAGNTCGPGSPFPTAWPDLVAPRAPGGPVRSGTRSSPVGARTAS